MPEVVISVAYPVRGVFQITLETFSFMWIIANGNAFNNVEPLNALTSTDGCSPRLCVIVHVELAVNCVWLKNLGPPWDMQDIIYPLNNYYSKT